MTTRKPRRRGVFLTETIAAGVAVAAAMAITLQLLSLTLAVRRDLERRGWAREEAANLMERLSAVPFDTLSTDSARALASLSPPAASVLPGGRVEVKVSEAKIAEGAVLKRINLAIVYRGPSGREESPVRLAAWVARRGEGR